MKILVSLMFLILYLHAEVELIKEKKVINVITRNAPTTFYYGPQDMKRGFEFDLVEAFAKNRGYEVNYIVKDSIKEVLHSLENSEGDFAAAGLSDTKLRREKFLIGPAYYKVQEQVVCGYKKHQRVRKS